MSIVAAQMYVVGTKRLRKGAARAVSEDPAELVLSMVHSPSREGLARAMSTMTIEPRSRSPKHATCTALRCHGNQRDSGA